MLRRLACSLIVLLGLTPLIPAAAAATSVTAVFKYSPASPVAGSPVAFDATGSRCLALPCSYTWTDDADGSTLGSGKKMSFTFQQEGTKYVRLTVKDARARKATVEHNVIVVKTMSTPVPTFTFSPSVPTMGSAVSFNAAGTTCSATPCSYLWTDDADGSQLGSGVSMSFTFQYAGTKKVRVTVTDSRSQTASVEHDVIVSTAAPAPPAPPAAGFTFSPSAPVVGTAVLFDGSSSACSASPCSYSWSDDSNGSQLGTGVSTTLTFQQSGTRLVRLTVSDAQSRSASVEHDVIVSQPNTPPAPGAFYVSNSGSDSNPGTSSSPWKTIQKAANTLNAGETAIVSAGTYSERVQITRSGSAGRLITLQAQGTVVMRGFNISGSYVKVSGFEVTNTPDTSATDRSNGSGFYVSGSNNEVSGNYVHHSTAAGIYLTSSANGLTVSGNRVAYAVECAIFIQGSNNLIASNDLSHTRSVSNSDADGIRFFGSGNTVRRNYIHDLMLSDSPGQSPHIDSVQTWGPATNYVFEQNLMDKDPSQDQGFTIEGLTQPVGSIIIRNNVFITRGTGYQPDANVGDMGLVTNVSIVNNTMVALNGAVEYAIWLFPNLSGAVVKNNAIHNHGNSGEPYIKVESGATGLDIGFNSISASNNQAPRGSAYPGDLWMVNPLFTNLGALDFHLLPTSILINRGTNLSQVPNDYDGMARPQGLMPDIGAFEYVLVPLP